MEKDMAEVAQDTKPIAAQTFRLRTQLLEKGRTHTILASAPKDRTNGMNIAIKCYAEGGENAFHAHDLEDHTFIVLQGRAQFYQPDSPPKDLGRNEGILIPSAMSINRSAARSCPRRATGGRRTAPCCTRGRRKTAMWNRSPSTAPGTNKS
jgi:quercetin dioxygenase-like cupin family protein